MPAAKSTLAAEIDGTLLTAGDAGYDDACSTWNARFSSRPDLIVQPRTASDVAAAVRFATRGGIAVTVKGGGHDYAGKSAAAGGVLIDLSAMRDVAIDPQARRATVGGGATWAEFDSAAQAHGLATTGGSVSSVGIGGVTLGGGEGWLSRKHGHTVDNLVGAEVVTAAGEIVRASEDENPDLFWALRGGGGNFGVVTTFEYRLHPVGPEIMAGQVIYPFDDAREHLRYFRDHFLDAPDELAGFAFFLRVPPVEPFPEAFHGQLAFDFVLAYIGPVDEGEEALAPFRTLGEPILDVIAPQSYVALQQSFDAGLPAGYRWYTRAHTLPELSDTAIDTLTGGLDPFPGLFTTVYLGSASGACGRVPTDATAYPHRGGGFTLHVFPGWQDPAQDSTVMAWARGIHEAMAPYASAGAYVNLLGEDEDARVPAAYAANFDRLVALKQKWDPENVFSSTHNIEPV